MYKNISVLLLIACVAVPSFALQYPRDISPTCELAVVSRRRTFLLQNATNQSDPPLSRHYVIPATRLINFFNTALSKSNNFNDYHESRKLLIVVSNLAERTLQFYLSNTAAEIDSRTMDFLRRFHNTATFEDLKPTDSPFDSYNMPRMINHLFMSMPFNIFEGPLSRSDDPGLEFDQLARAIIGQELFDELRIIDKDMTRYNRQASVAVFDCIVSRLISLISKHTWHITTYDSIQWKEEENGKYHIFIWYSKKENQYRSLKRKREINEGYNLDPYCYGAEKYLNDHGDEIYNVAIVGKAFDRVLDGKGFSNAGYSWANSWKDWYDQSQWFSLVHGLSNVGRNMVEGSPKGKPYGYTFNDGSFAVGIIGDDVKYGNDNWKTLEGSNWGTGDEYAGQIFFDKHGQPVALVISRTSSGLLGIGWSFIYNNGKWEYEHEDDWDTRRFAGSTLSLDSRAPKFLNDNESYIGTVIYSYGL